MLSSTQVVNPKSPFAMENMVSGYIYVQEITATKDYIHGLALQFATSNRKSSNDYDFLILNHENQILFREKFSSEFIEGHLDPQGYFLVNLKQNVYVRAGNTIYLCIYSNNGDQNNNVTVWCDQTSTIGKLYVSRIKNNDIITSVGNKAKLYPGSFILRTYESDSSGSLFYKICFSLIAVFISLCIIFIRKIKPGIIKSKIQAEKIFLLLSCVFGICFVFTTPPMQVPDEAMHLYRSYQLSEFNVLKINSTIPASLSTLDSQFGRLVFKPDEKTTVHEIISIANTKLEPTRRSKVLTNETILPYIPQAFGMLIGRLLELSPLILLYLGRIFNLFISIFIIYLAIRITPVLKWIFFLAGLMPKTLFQLASLSHDALTISLSFLLIALILRYALENDKKIHFRDIFLLFLISLAVTECKIPYFILGFLVFLIPVHKIGSASRYMITLVGLLLSVFLATQLWSIGHQWFIPAESSATITTNPTAERLDSLKTSLNPGAQIHFITGNIGQYAGILLNTVLINQRSNLLNNSFGDLGWLDTPLPDILRNIYFIILIIAALGISTMDINISILNKLKSFIIFLSGIALIATAMYICCSFVGNNMIYGIQGRYLIPFIPLLCLLFYNQSISNKLNLVFSSRKNELARLKKNEKSNLLKEIQRSDRVFNKFLVCFLILTSVITLVWTMIILVTRYYKF